MTKRVEMMIKEEVFQLGADEDTLPKLLKRNYERWGTKVVAIRDKDFGIWQEYSWKHEYEQVKYFGLGLISLGLKSGDKVAIIGDNEPELYWANLAIQAVHSISVALFPGATPAEMEFILNHSDSKFVVARDQEQVDKLLEIWDKLPKVEKVIWWYWKGVSDYTQPFLLSWDKMIEMGRKHEEEHPGIFEKLISQTKADDTANIYYTCGTAGQPKGVMWTHQALIGSTQAMLARFPLSDKDNLLCFLPVAFIGESLFNLIPHLITGAKLNCPERSETVPLDMREVAPSLMLSEPKYWEELAKTVQTKINEAGMWEKLAYKIFMPIGLKVGELNMVGEKPNPFLRFAHWLANLILLSSIRGYLGLSKTRFPLTTGAVLSVDTLKFLHGLGIKLREVFVSTEAGVISGHAEDDIKPGTLGSLFIKVELKIADDGEILVLSPYVFSGYFKQADLYKDVVDEQGWWHSADVGYIDEETMHLVYLDRKEALATFATGTKYAPQHIESRLRFSPYIKDVIAIGGKGMDYVTAIVNIDIGNMGRWAEKSGVVYTTIIDLSQKPEVAELIRGEIERVNTCLPPETRVMKYVCLHKGLDADEGDLTRMRKLKRHTIAERYKKLVKAMYSGSAEYLMETPITYSDGRKGVVKTSLKIWKSKAGEETLE
ncbi:MAG: AMP-binding protein [Dehalococcoidia bacterium]|nr:MAG: AMP-binding protein [Dehalococcoidia bacterium]